jgi:hypothetical protein
MQPLIAAEKVKNAYWRYIETSFPIRRDALRGGFRQLVEEQWRYREDKDHSNRGSRTCVRRLGI